MKETVLIENRYAQKGWHKIKFCNPADDNLVIDQVKKDEMTGRLQKKAGKSKEETGKLIKEL
ncbi:MAG: general stress protein CsbD [Bacteroidetes bacterium]|nr:MAG: general stress protein CsbD [Bacteroidota bacterium]